MTRADPEAFVDRFARVWASPEPETFADLWADGGVLLHPTMGEAIPREQIPDYVRRLKSFVPDISLAPIRWAAQGDDVFIEWTITMTPPGDDEQVSWNGVDRSRCEATGRSRGSPTSTPRRCGRAWVRLPPRATCSTRQRAVARPSR